MSVPWACLSRLAFSLAMGVFSVEDLLLAQTEVAAGRGVTVPFVGCPADGQVGPIEAPKGTRISLRIDPEAARQLAYYRSAKGLGILAPRGWHCLGTYGSSGDSLLVIPRPVKAQDLFSSSRAGFLGPAISSSRKFGDTSGRFPVAETIARVFPVFTPFVTSVVRGFDLPPDTFPSGPYPADTLTYKSATLVEFRTGAGAKGLGTHSWLEKDEDPIDGVAVLVGDSPDLLLLAVRLPRCPSSLTRAIVGHFEREAADLSNK